MSKPTKKQEAQFITDRIIEDGMEYGEALKSLKRHKEWMENPVSVFIDPAFSESINVATWFAAGKMVRYKRLEAFKGMTSHFYPTPPEEISEAALKVREYMEKTGCDSFMGLQIRKNQP